jgi:hypothetical protein
MPSQKAEAQKALGLIPCSKQQQAVFRRPHIKMFKNGPEQGVSNRNSQDPALSRPSYQGLQPMIIDLDINKLNTMVNLDQFKSNFSLREARWAENPKGGQFQAKVRASLLDRKPLKAV